MVSIVLPVYNGEEYVSESISSILAQTYYDFELIIVNDASSDSTITIISKYAKKDNRIKIIENKTNLRLPKSLNVGFKQAKGEYFTWTSDDNIYEDNAIEEMVKVLEENKKIDVVYAQCVIIDKKGRKKRKGYASKIEEIYFKNCIQACFLYRATVDKVLNGYNEKTFLYEDYDFWLRAYESKFKFYFLSKILYRYRVHNKSLSFTKNKEISEFNISVLKKNLRRVGKKNIKLRATINIRISDLYKNNNQILLYWKYKLFGKAYNFSGEIMDKYNNRYGTGI